MSGVAQPEIARQAGEDMLPVLVKSPALVGFWLSGHFFGHAFLDPLSDQLKPLVVLLVVFVFFGDGLLVGCSLYEGLG